MVKTYRTVVVKSKREITSTPVLEVSTVCDFFGGYTFLQEHWVVKGVYTVTSANWISINFNGRRKNEFYLTEDAAYRQKKNDIG